MRKTFDFLVAAAAIGLIPALGLGEDKQDGAGDSAAALFSQIDSNKDGQLSDDEVPEDKKGMFQRLVRAADKNGDGKLSQEEFAAGLKEQRAERPLEKKDGEGAAGAGGIFKMLDKNGDGKVTLDEIPEEHRDKFERLLSVLGKKSSDSVTQEEFAKGMSGGGGAGAPSAEQIFEHLDANKDGKLTLSEVPEDRRDGFEKILTHLGRSGDQGITKDELAAAMKMAEARKDEGKTPERTPGESTPSAGKPAGKRPEGGRDPEKMFDRLDKNGDGKLTADEIPEARRENFVSNMKRAGKNPDEGVSKEQWIKMMSAMQGRGEGAGEGRGQMLSEAVFKRWDKNGDGKVTADEVPEERREMVGKLIERFDADGDKALSAEEFKAASEKSREVLKGRRGEKKEESK